MTADENRKEVLVDFDGTSKPEFEKPLVDDDTYLALIKSCELVEVPSYDGKGTTKKLIFSLGLEDVKGKPEIPLYVNPVIKKSGGQKGYSNSKLFDLLVSAGELDNAKSNHAVLETFEGLHAWIEKVFVGRYCKVLTKTTNQGKDNAYSVVDKVIKFEPKDTPTKKYKEKIKAEAATAAE